MNAARSEVQAFSVKVWLEETVEEVGQATWRGHITHVSSGERQHLKDLREIAEFIGPYLKGMDARVDTRP